MRSRMRGLCLKACVPHCCKMSFTKESTVLHSVDESLNTRRLSVKNVSRCQCVTFCPLAVICYVIRLEQA